MVQLVVAESQLPDFIDMERVTSLRTKLEGLAWFQSYQSLPLVGLLGERTLNRFGLMDIERLRDQVVLDFGCNVGGASLKAVQAGDKARAADAFKTAQSVIDSIADKGIFHKNKAARHKSRLSAKIKGMTVAA